MINIIGKNGAGKSYIANKLYDFGFQRNVGYTTRPMRDGEINGIDYFFITREEFEENISKGNFADYKVRNGFYYGILKDNINHSTILVSGDVKKIEENTGCRTLSVYIDCDLSTRYLRVLKRNEAIQDTFNRFHTENFSYLYDFNAVFINNSFNNDASLNEVMGFLRNGNFTDDFLLANRSFLAETIKKKDVLEISDCEDKLLMLLRYEEYLMRKLFLGNYDLYSSETIKIYYNSLFSFMTSNNIDYMVLDGILYALIDDNEYKIDYKIKRRVK